MLHHYWQFVGKLTAGLSRRREIDALLIALLLSLAAASNANTPEWQPTDEIAAAAEEFLRGRLGPRASRTTVQAGQLDPRHLLAHCPGQMEPFLRRGSKISARTIVGVRCTGTRKWTVSSIAIPRATLPIKLVGRERGAAPRPRAPKKITTGMRFGSIATEPRRSERKVAVTRRKIASAARPTVRG